MRPRSERDQIQSVIESLHVEFAPHGADESEIRRAVEHEYSHYRRAPIRTYVPALVHRAARERLRSGRSAAWLAGERAAEDLRGRAVAVRRW